MCFLGNLILSTSCEFYYDDVTVTLFINIKYGDVTGKSIPGHTLHVYVRLWRLWTNWDWKRYRILHTVQT